jgi:hypothetical protein
VKFPPAPSTVDRRLRLSGGVVNGPEASRRTSALSRERQAAGATHHREAWCVPGAYGRSVHSTVRGPGCCVAPRPMYNPSMPETNPQQMQPRPHVRERGWKRTVATALLLLVGGAIVNVTVAWGLATRLPPQGFTAKYATLDDVRLFIDEQVGSRYVYAGRRRDIDSELERADWSLVLRSLPTFSPFKDPQYLKGGIDSISGGTDFAQIGEHAHGWPLLSLRCEYRVRFVTGASPPPEVQFKGGFEFEVGGSSKRLIPYEPIWPTFAINTLFYALLLWLLFFAPFAARRMIRRRRGQCEKCAYPVGTSSVCTECGAAVTSTPDAG